MTARARRAVLAPHSLSAIARSLSLRPGRCGPPPARSEGHGASQGPLVRLSSNEKAHTFTETLTFLGNVFSIRQHRKLAAVPRDRQAEGVLQRRGRAVSLSFPRLRSAAQEAVHGRVTAATRVGRAGRGPRGVTCLSARKRGQLGGN